MAILKLKAHSPQQGADTAVWLATSDEAHALHGSYVGNRQAIESSAESQDPETAARLWNATAQMTGLEP